MNVKAGSEENPIPKEYVPKKSFVTFLPPNKSISSRLINTNNEIATKYNSYSVPLIQKQVNSCSDINYQNLRNVSPNHKIRIIQNYMKDANNVQYRPNYEINAKSETYSQSSYIRRIEPTITSENRFVESHLLSSTKDDK